MTSWGRADFEQLKNLQKNLAEFDKIDRQALCEKLSKEIAARLLRMVIKRTPTGKKPGFEGEKTEKVKGASGKIRSFLTADYARYQTYWSGYRGGNLRRSWTIIPIARSGNKYVICVKNISEYASFVENGHRQEVGRYVPALGKKLTKPWVEGRFMLTISENKIKGIAPKLIEKRVKEALEEAFNAQ